MALKLCRRTQTHEVWKFGRSWSTHKQTGVRYSRPL